MNRRENSPDEFLDLIVDDVRNEAVDSAVVEDSSRRAWERIAKQASQSARLSSCADFQSLISAYRDGSLAPGRRMLLEDHTHECVVCRKALFGEPEPAAKVVEMPARSLTRGKWLTIAASVTVALVFGGYAYDQFAPAAAGSRGVVQAVNGQLFRVRGSILQPVSTGTEVAEGDVLRTAAGSSAFLKLMDGSIVEAGERAEFRLAAARRDMTLHLNRGAVIVQAAKRLKGHLYVASGDSRVAVMGTVFSVNRGAKGTRVSVMEGEVIVEHAHSDKVLHSGDQLATHRSIQSVPIQQEIAWSRNASEHLKLMQNIADIKESLQNVRMPGVRYNSRLIDTVPANSVVFLSLPNLRETFADAQQLLGTQLQRAGGDVGAKATNFIQSIGKFSEFLGDEFVIASVMSGKDHQFIGVADVHRPGLKQFLETELQNAQGTLRFRIVEGDQPVSAGSGTDPIVAIRGDRVVFGVNADLVNGALAGGTGFSATPFGQRILQSFRQGTGILLGVDLHSLIEREAANAKDRTVLNRTGGDDVRYLIVEQKTLNGKTQNTANLTFAGQRQGMASWLAAPGTMGGLGFVSPRAQFAASVITKDPRQMIEEVFSFVEAQGAKSVADLQKLQQVIGVDLRQDIAAALGSEATFAIDGPLLPTPSWKVVVEVDQPERLQQSISRMVSSINLELQKEGRGNVRLDTENTNRGALHGLTITSVNSPVVNLYYTYRDGYLVAAATKDLVWSAIDGRASGMRLDTSDTFRRMLPTDQNANFSALIYQNAEEALKALSTVIPENQQQARELAAKIGPSLIGAYAESDRIQVTTFGSSMDLLMQMAFAPALHGHYNGPAVKKHGTMGTMAAYR